MPSMQATMIPAQAVSKLKSAAEFLIWTPSGAGRRRSTRRRWRRSSRARSPPSARRRGRAERSAPARVRKISKLPAAYERISSIGEGRTEVSPRSVFTSTGKKQSTASDRHLRALLERPNHAFAIGAKAMIGIALAAIAIRHQRRRRARRQRASTSATTIPAPLPDDEAAERLLERVPAGRPERAPLVPERRRCRSAAAAGSAGCRRR